MATPFFGASLDHAVWFHRSSSPYNWHLHLHEGINHINNRGLASGKIYSQVVHTLQQSYKNTSAKVALRALRKDKKRVIAPAIGITKIAERWAIKASILIVRL